MLETADSDGIEFNNNNNTNRNPNFNKLILITSLFLSLDQERKEGRKESIRLQKKGK
jgi:hypothetical protein